MFSYRFTSIRRDKSLRALCPSARSSCRGHSHAGNHGHAGNHVTVAHQPGPQMAPNGSLVLQKVHCLHPMMLHQKVHWLHQKVHWCCRWMHRKVHKPDSLTRSGCQCGQGSGVALVLQLDPAQHQAAQATTHEDKAVQEEEHMKGSAGAGACT